MKPARPKLKIGERVLLRDRHYSAGEVSGEVERISYDSNFKHWRIFARVDSHASPNGKLMQTYFTEEDVIRVMSESEPAHFQGAWVRPSDRATTATEPVRSSTVIDTPASDEGAKQEALPPAAIASTTAASLCATIGAQLAVTAQQTYPEDLVEIDRELMQVQALREIAKWANDEAIRKAQRAARKPGATLAKVGAALGVSRQRVHQLLYPEGRY